MVTPFQKFMSMVTRTIAAHFASPPLADAGLLEQLAAGYRASAQQDLAIAAEWFPLEEEAQLRSEASQIAPKN
jgi:hypothetical protein